MSRKKWLIVAALALADVIVLGAMAVIVIRSLTQSPPAPAPTVAASPTPTATPPPTWTPTFSPTPVSGATLTSTPTQAPTPVSGATPTATPTLPPTPVLAPLENPTFENIQGNSIPGWHTGSFVNWAPGDDFDAAASYAAPRFHQADDQRQWIDGPTLQIDTEPWVKLRAWVFQTVEVEPGSSAQFEVQARGFVEDTAGGYILRAGLDPDGGEGCEAARWGDERIANQDDGVITLTAPEATVGQAGRVTVCLFAETQFAQVYHAAFFDDAALTVLPSR
ncbi:MAG: hypothetical protein U9R15_12970 [Chloroflexota bacterium]|nr:hypothetical protein [Chloroflexota bacterium]